MLRLTRQLSLSIALTCAATATVFAQGPEQQRAPVTAAQYVEAGNRYAQERQFDKAVDAFREAIRLDPNLAAAYALLGRAYLVMGRTSDALAPTQTFARLEPNNAMAHVDFGIVLAILRRRDEALAEMNEAKRLNPNNARVQNELGNVLHNSFGRIEDALAAYTEAHRLSPEVAAYAHNIGLMLIKLGRFKEAIPALQDALNADPQYRNARYLLGEAHNGLGHYKEAIECWTKFLEIVQHGPDALTNRAWDYLYLGHRGKEAAADAREFLSVHGWGSQRSVFMVLIAQMGYREAGMEQEAAAILDEAAAKVSTAEWPYPVVRYLKGELTGEELLRLASDNDKRTEAHAYLGVDLLLKGDAAAARAHFEWVRDYGNKRFFEYPLAIEELKRLGR